MQRVSASLPVPVGMASAWLARRWYYTPKTHRAYSVRQISPGDRRLLAEFACTLHPVDATEPSAESQDLTTLLFDRVLGAAGSHAMAHSMGMAALESTAAGDRIIGIAAYAPDVHERTEFAVAVLPAYRDEQIGRTLLSSLMRHAKRVGVPSLNGEMRWANRAMQTLAMSLGFTVEPHPRDRNLRRLTLQLK